MFLATMETEHYTFRAIASTADDAKKAIKRGWKAHMKQCLKNGATWDGIPLSEIEEWYGINVFPMEMNECLRDDSILGVK